MNIPYLLKILGTDKVSELVQNIDLAPIDINIAVWSAIDEGQVAVDEVKGTITSLVEPIPTCDKALADKLLVVIQHYASKELNVTRGVLNNVVKDPMTNTGYQWHEYIMALQWLIDMGKVEEFEVSVPKTKKRPYHKFVFIGLPGNPNEEWNAREINKWIDNFSTKKVK